jgi:uncharacterized protein
MSAAQVKLKYPECKLVGYNYYEPIPEEVWNSGDVIMVDVSFDPQTMLDIQLSGVGFTWIDHHANTIQKVQDLFDNQNVEMPFGSRNPKYAACELTWMDLFKEGNPLPEPMPELVRALGRYDCWGHVGTSEEEAIFQFQYGARRFIHNVDEAFYYLQNSIAVPEFRKDTLNKIQIAGHYIYRYLCEDAKWAYEHKHTVIFDDEENSHVKPIMIAFINKYLNPKAMKLNYEADGYDVCAVFNIHVNGMVKVTLYSDTVDCAVLASSFGGGGHKGAAGFQMPLPEFQTLLNIKQ